MLSSEDQGGQMPRPSEYRFDVNNLCLLPRFNERDPDTFFLLLGNMFQLRPEIGLMRTAP